MSTMSNPSRPLLRFMVVFSLSISAFKPYAFLLPPSSSPPPKATGTDLLAVLGPPSQASSVNPTIASELRSCFRFLVPFSQVRRESEIERCSSHGHLRLGREDVIQDDNQLVRCPPEPVLELARLAVDSGGDPDSIYRTLDPTVIPVPEVEGSKEHRCELTRTPYGRRFISEELNSYFEYMFKLIVSRGPKVGLNVSLSRFDLFHGHLFLAQQTGRLGILFHAKEYPAYEKDVFPYNMGYCQIGSEVTYDDSMNLRNILWLAPMPSNSTRDWLAPGVLVVLDAHPDGIIYKDLIPEYVQSVRTIYEEVLGNTAVDINYLNVGNPKPKFQLFLC